VSDTSSPAAGFTPLTSSDSEDAALIEQLKQKLGTSEQRLQVAELKIQLLEERLRQMLIIKYGASSEKLSSAQLQLLELEPGVSSRIASRSIPAARHCRRICRAWRRSWPARPNSACAVAAVKRQR
jgi:hypothetical protein